MDGGEVGVVGVVVVVMMRDKRWRNYECKGMIKFEVVREEVMILVGWGGSNWVCGEGEGLLYYFFVGVVID